MSSDVKAEQLLKASDPTMMTPLGIRSSFRLEQFANMLFMIRSKFGESVTLSNDVQSSKTELSVDVMLSGILTETRLLQPENAFRPR